MKNLLITLTTSLLLLTSCGSGSYYNFTNKEERANVDLSKNKVNVRNFNLSLFETKVSSRKRVGDEEKSEFLNGKQMKELMTNTVNTLLEENNYLSDNKDAYQYDINITASRNFHFLSKKYLALNIESMKIDVYKDDKLIANKYLEGAKSGLVQTGAAIDCGNNRGFSGNLKTVAKGSTGVSGQGKQEIEDVKYCSISLYNSIIDLGK